MIFYSSFMNTKSAENVGIYWSVIPGKYLVFNHDPLMLALFPKIRQIRGILEDTPAKSLKNVFLYQNAQFCHYCS